MELLVEYQWPGNVRELRNVIERLAIMVAAKTIQPLDLASSLRQGGLRREVWPTPDGTLRDARSRFEREFILRRLEENEWNVTRTAERLGIERSNLHRKIRAYGIEGSGR
jgi:two-component system nitrogen regulation response regulator NtrX